MKYHHGDLRRALIEAAIEVAATQGLEAIKVSALARALGVSSGAPFRHFGSRLELLVAAAEHAAAHMISALEVAARGVEDPVEVERARGVAYVRYAVENPGHFRLLTNAQVLDASETLGSRRAESVAAMDAAWGEGDASALARSAATLAAQAMILGLAQMCVEGLLGDISPEQAELLALATTGVLGTGLSGA